jgi:chitin synthase
MRFIVLIDLLGTILLPATTVYLVYLIVSVSTGTAAVPIISLVMIAAVYGLQVGTGEHSGREQLLTSLVQVIIFLLHRQWQFIGWLVIYILAFPCVPIPVVCRRF